MLLEVLELREKVLKNFNEYSIVFHRRLYIFSLLVLVNTCCK